MSASTESSGGVTPEPGLGFAALTAVHEKLDELFHLHQDALLRQDMGEADAHLASFARGIHDHIRVEEMLVIPIYESRGTPPPGGEVALFLTEHRKIEQLLGHIQDCLRTLARGSNFPRKETIRLLDQEAQFKHLLAHHDLRERRFLYPILDRITTAEERATMLRTAEAMGTQKSGHGGDGHRLGDQGAVTEFVSPMRDLLGIVQETLIAAPRVEDVRIGVFFTAVRLANGAAGVAATPTASMPQAVCCPRSAAEWPEPEVLAGARAIDLARWATDGETPLRAAVGVATLNALSSILFECLGQDSFRALRDADALDQVQVKDGAHVVLIGAFAPYLRRLSNHRVRLSLFELNLSAVGENERRFWHPSEEMPEHLQQADVVIATGATLVNGSFDGILAATRPGARLVLTGPTASLYPTPFFRVGVSAMAGIRVKDPERLLEIVSRGASGYHLMRSAAEKVVYQSLKRVDSPQAAVCSP